MLSQLPEKVSLPLHWHEAAGTSTLTGIMMRLTLRLIRLDLRLAAASYEQRDGEQHCDSEPLALRLAEPLTAACNESEGGANTPMVLPRVREGITSSSIHMQVATATRTSTTSTSSTASGRSVRTTLYLHKTSH